MAVNGAQPFVKVLDSNGVPIVGAVLHVYEVGTTTNRAIYSDAALTVPLTNPLSGVQASNSSGDFPRFYMAAGLYKLRAETAVGGLIWEYDNIDTGIATGGALPIASGGTGSTTASAALTALGAAAASDITALAAQITAFSGSLQNLVSQPQGRLTLTSGSPILAVGVAAATSVYYTPYIGNLCPIYDGVQFNPKVFAELTLALDANHVLNSHYDCFIINDSGTIRIVTGPAWTTITAGSGARGAGAGTTELTRLNGLWVNANAMATARNGATTYAVTANQGTYVGSLYIDGTAGQITCHTAYGQNRKWGVWNAFNRQIITTLTGDATASWTQSGGSFAAVNATANNSGFGFCGLPDEPTLIRYLQQVNLTYSSNTASASNAIGVNSTTVASGFTGQYAVGNNTTAGGAIGVIEAEHTQLPTIGLNKYTMLESRGNTATASGTLPFCLMSLKWQG